jgi:hypothetical protein
MQILWQNCLLQYQTEIARKAWLWFAETRGSGMQHDADRYANEVEVLVKSLRPMLQMSAGQNDYSDEMADGVLAFAIERHANWRLGGNIKLPFLVTT